MIAPDTDRPDLVAIDIGNTRIAIAAMLDANPVAPESVRTGDLDAVRKTIRDAWRKLDSEYRAVAIASVAPDALTQVRQIVQDECDVNPLIIRDDIDLSMELAIENPDTVGVDRICCALAAYVKLEQACAVVDLGTAVTIDCVNDDGVFLGGAILPGLELAARSLKLHTAALPMIDFAEPQDPIGRDTEQAIRCGIYYGLIGAIRELTELYATALGKWPHVILTGGNAEMIAKGCQFVDSVVPYLSLIGVDLMYRLHMQQPAE